MTALAQQRSLSRGSSKIIAMHQRYDGALEVTNRRRPIHLGLTPIALVGSLCWSAAAQSGQGKPSRRLWGRHRLTSAGSSRDPTEFWATGYSWTRDPIAPVVCATNDLLPRREPRHLPELA